MNVRANNEITGVEILKNLATGSIVEAMLPPESAISLYTLATKTGVDAWTLFGQQELETSEDLARRCQWWFVIRVGTQTSV